MKHGESSHQTECKYLNDMERIVKIVTVLILASTCCQDLYAAEEEELGQLLDRLLEMSQPQVSGLTDMTDATDVSDVTDSADVTEEATNDTESSAQMQDEGWKAYLNGDALEDWKSLAPLFDKAAEGGHSEDLQKGLSRLIKGWGLMVRILSSDTYRDRLKGVQILLSRTQAGPGRTVKQEQEKISPNHVQAF